MKIFEIKKLVPSTELFGPSGNPEICIIGAGFGGINMGVVLRRAGIPTFTIIEKNSSIGGTWYENRYPGAEVDSESHLYCLKSKTHNWTRNFSRQPELLSYLIDTADEYDLWPHIKLNAQVQAAIWNEETHMYTVSLTDAVEMRFNVVVSAVGIFNSLNIPQWPGLESFSGVKFHAARWEEGYNFSGKRVAVVGTGSSSAQIVPELAKKAKKLLLYQREPCYVVQKNAREFSSFERFIFASPLARRLERMRCYWRARESRKASAAIVGSKLNKKLEHKSITYLNRVFSGRPDLRELLTPKYPFMGKRTVISDDYYPALLRDNVEIIPHAVTHVTPTGLVDSEGIERQVDAIVMATGFQPANYLANLRVRGSNGVWLHDFWKTEPRALLGSVVSGFPNFYMLYGPNSNGGEILFFEHAQARYALANIKRMKREGITSIDVSENAMNKFNAWLQRRLGNTAFGRSATGVKLGYYLSPTGRNVTQWSQGLALFFILALTLPRFVSLVSTRRSED